MMKSLDFSAPAGVFFGNGELRRLTLHGATQTMQQTGILDEAVGLVRKGSADVVVPEDRNPEDYGRRRGHGQPGVRCVGAPGFAAGEGTPWSPVSRALRSVHPAPVAWSFISRQ
jgi:hypothetical protein